MQELARATGDSLTPRSRKTRQALIDAAAAVIAEVGVKALSVAAVVEKARLTRPSLYYYFQDLDELIAAVYKQLDRQLVVTVPGVSNIAMPYTRHAVQAAEARHLYRLRLLEMLNRGASKDVLTQAYFRTNSRFEREGDLQEGIDPQMAALVHTSSMAAAYLAVSAKGIFGRTEDTITLFGQTYYESIFFGVLKPDLQARWPRMPRYSQAQVAPVSEPSPEGKRVSARSAKTRESLLSAGIQLMGKEGGSAVSVAEVAGLAGITRRAAYHHFEDGKALLRAIRDKLDREYFDDIDRFLTTREPFAAAADLATEEQNILNLRVKKLLHEGVAGDPLVIYQRQAFRWHKTHGHIREGVDADMAAILAAAIAVMGAAQVLSMSDDLVERQRLLHRFAITYRRFLFHGIFRHDSGRAWPAPP